MSKQPDTCIRGPRRWLRYWTLPSRNDSLDGLCMLAKICAVTGVVVAGFLILVAMQPEGYRVQRAAKVAAPP